MTTERETLRIIGSWMEDGRTRLPDHVLDAVLDQLPSTPQRRPPWSAGRITHVIAGAKYAIAAAAVLIVAIVGLVLPGTSAPGQVGGASHSSDSSPSASPVSPSASTSLRQSPAPGFSRFTSTLNRISVDYPSGWEVRPATEPWGLNPVGFAATDNDVIFDPALQDDPYVGLASGVLGVQSEPPDLSFGLGAATKMCDPANWGGHGDWGGGAGRYFMLARLSLPSDGVRGWAGYCHGDQEGPVNRYAFVATATRGYVIYLHVEDPSINQSYDERWFDDLLRTVDLLP